MKFAIEKSGVTISSETKEEALLITSFAMEHIFLELPTLEEPKKVRKHKKHQHVKKCDQCGKACKGKKGLSIHMAKTHKVFSPDYEKNKQHYETQKKKKETSFNEIWK